MLKTLIGVQISIYILFTLIFIKLLSFQIIKRRKEKDKDDNELDKYKDY